MGIFDKLKEKKKKKGGTNKNTDARDKSHKKQATDKQPRKKGSVLEKKKKGGTSKDNSARNKRHKKQANDPMIGKTGSVYKKTNQDGGSYTAKKPGAAAKQLEALGKKTGPVKKTEARVARDYAANAAYDAEHGYKKEAKFEKKKLMHVVNRIAGSKNR